LADLFVDYHANGCVKLVSLQGTEHNLDNTICDPMFCYELHTAWKGWNSLYSQLWQHHQQEAQLMLTTGSTRLAVSRGQQTWYHSTCYMLHI